MPNLPNIQLTINAFGTSNVQASIYTGKITVPEKDQSQVLRKSKLGTAIFSDLQFGDIFIPINGALTQATHVPIDTALFSVNQTKNVVRTSINGRDGTIKEYIGMGDYTINIKGVICGANGVYPADEVDSLKQFLVYDQSIPILSKFLNEVFDIYEVVILDYDINQEEGGQSYQKFEINCVSEKPVEILIQEQK